MQKMLTVLPVMCALAVTACGEAEVAGRTISLSGTIIAPDNISANASVRVNLYHAWALEGVLRHPLAEIESFDAGPQPFGCGNGLKTGDPDTDDKNPCRFKSAGRCGHHYG